MTTHARPISVFTPWTTLFRHWVLIRKMTDREVVGRYRGSIMGVFWSFFNPLLLLAVYTFVFGEIFKARWGTGGESRAEFAIVLFVGMIIHGLFAECANRAPTLIVGNPSYVKKVVFPLEVLPWVAVGTALFHTLVSTLVLLLAQLALFGRLPVTALAFPAVLLVFLPAVVGAVWLLASFGVYVRDLQQAVGIATMAMLFLSPVFYPSSAVSPPYRDWLLYNPLTFVIEQAREVLVWGHWPDWLGLAIYATGASLFAFIALWWFERTRGGFADVL